MEEKQFRITAKAKQDLLAIGKYTATKWGQSQRNIYLKKLDDAFHLLCKNPTMGKDNSYIVAGYRKFQKGSHVIYYKVTDPIEIIRILHESMDIDAHLSINHNRSTSRD